jgi:hypothetical protein
LIKLFKNNIEEIKRVENLFQYGLYISLTHLFTFFYWNKNNFFVSSQSPLNAEPLCFPFFPNCDLWRNLISPFGWSAILYIYLILSLFTIYLFVNKEKIKMAYFMLIFVTLFKALLQFSNYNFMGNYHYMIYLITLIYLFVPGKISFIKIMIVAFYFSAGILKINIDWLSGAAMISTPVLKGNLLLASLYYVIFLELLFSFGLLIKNQVLRVFCLFQFIAFHIFSWHVVGFFYPLVMFCLLSIFLLDEYSIWKNHKKNNNIILELINFKNPRLHYFILLIFIFLQIIPNLITKDPSLSGAPRLSSLNMFDSRTECQSILIAHRSKDSIHIERPLKHLGVRLQCDPLIYLNQAHQLCRQNQNSKEFEKLSLSLLSRRVTANDYVKVLDFKDICSLENILWAEFSKQESQL